MHVKNAFPEAVVSFEPDDARQQSWIPGRRMWMTALPGAIGVGNLIMMKIGRLRNT